ncbi:transcription antitermination factor NusB [Candidatus Roizmanbacteria bacterium]|nr:transcription antitermination factor NusB [Candidatus Roizmanbacteria bacterium]
MDIRHQKRTSIIQGLYAYSFVPHEDTKKIDPKIQEIIKHSRKLNKAIEKYASKFPIDKIARVDVAILQLAIYELTIDKKEPPKVVINEAVELAKELGSEKSYAFINAVLGKVYDEILQ